MNSFHKHIICGDVQACHRAIRLFEEGKHDGAIQQLDGYVQDHAGNGRVWELLGVIEHSRSELDAAQIALETASLYCRLSLGGQIALIDCYIASNHRMAAIAIAEHLVVQLLPPDVVPEVVTRCSRLGLQFHALELCRKAAESNPSCPQALLGLAHYMGKCGYPHRLIMTILQRVVSLAPSNMFYRVTLCKVADKCGEASIAYESVANLYIARLAEIRCLHCLSVLQDVYAMADDRIRSQVCEKRRREITASRTRPDD